MRRDKGKGKESLGVGIQCGCKEKGFWKDRWVFHKYASKEDRLADRPLEVSVVEGGNLLLDVGINRMWQLITGDSALHFDESNATLGVGDSTTAAAAAQTDLQAATNKLYKAMAAGYPVTGADEKIVFRSVFGGTEANYDWREFVAKRTVCMNRLVSNQGTKVAGQEWTVTLEITLE